MAFVVDRFEAEAIAGGPPSDEDLAPYPVSAPWRFAKTMADIPHEYVVEGKVDDSAGFTGWRYWVMRGRGDSSILIINRQLDAPRLVFAPQSSMLKSFRWPFHGQWAHNLIAGTRAVALTASARPKRAAPGLINRYVAGVPEEGCFPSTSRRPPTLMSELVHHCRRLRGSGISFTTVS